MLKVSQRPNWQVKLYEQGNQSPVREFILSCSPIVQRKIDHQFKYIEQFGLTRAIPDLKKIIGAPFWELRILGKDNIRIICLAVINRTIVILHIFFKKKQKTPLKELKIAFQRYRQFVS